MTIHNPELHIATLNDDGRFEMELIVERGRGYVSSALNDDPNAEIGRIAVDSIYSPVLKVTYKVEATRVEQRTDFDKLVVDVETKPSILPRDAIASAGKTLVELFGLTRELNAEAEALRSVPAQSTRSTPRAWAPRSRNSTLPSVPTTASSVRASILLENSSRGLSRTCWPSVTSDPSRSMKSRKSSPSLA